MDYSMLNDLIAFPKKGDASKEKKNKYNSEMIMLFKEEGISEKSMKYFKDGFSFCGAQPLAIYLSELGETERLEMIQKLVSFNFYTMNERGITFKIDLSLLGYSLLLFPEDIRLLKEIIQNIPLSIKNKEGKIHKDAAKILEKYFLDVLTDNTQFPPIASIGLSEQVLFEFRDSFSKVLESIKPSSRVSLKLLNSIRNWTNSSNDDGGVHNVPIKEKALSEQDLIALREQCNQMVNACIIELEKNRELKKQLQFVASELSIAKNIIDEKSKEIENWILLDAKNKERISGLREIVNKQAAEIGQKDSELGQNQKTIESLNDNIEKLNSVLSVYSLDKEKSTAELLNKIAAKLKCEYMDFKDATSMEMTVDLGENLRLQLQSVFKILEKEGIDIEGRSK